MATDWSFLDENGDIKTACAGCSGSGLQGFEPEDETPHKGTELCVKCKGSGGLTDE